MVFWRELDHHGDKIAFVDAAGDRLSYAELAAAADSFADLPARSLILLEIDNSLAAMVAYVGALRRNLPAIIINAGDETATKRLTELFRPVALWSGARGLVPITQASAVVTHPDLGIMLSTSGSTGATKLVRLSAAAVDANARSIAAYLGLDADERPITTLPPGYSYGLSVINSHLAVGATIILNGYSVIDPAFRALIEAEAATSIAGVPYTYELLERGGMLADLPRSIRTLTQAGGRLSPEKVASTAAMAQRSGRRFFIMYGQTEATARMAYLPPDELPAHADCIGRPIPGGHFTLVDPETGATAQDCGELVYSGPNVMMGYAESAADLARESELDRLHTGDLAERVTPSLYRITGRKSRFLKLFGLRVALDEVERMLCAQGLSAVASGDDELLVVGVVGTEHEAAAAAIIDDRLGLPSSSRIVIPLPDIPRLPSGKVDFQAVRQAGREAWAAANWPTAGADSTESSALRAAYARALNRPAIQADDSFTGLAGDSLAYVEVSMAIERALGQLPDHWERMTIREIEQRAAERSVGPRHFRWVSTEMLIRPLAIALIVTAHALGPGPGYMLQGGALTLLMTAGYNSSRFQRDRLISAERWSLIWQFFVRLIIPYYVMLGIYGLLSKNHIGWRTLALVTNYWKDPGVVSMVQFWFIQTLFQCVVLCVALFQIGPIKNFATRSPWRFALAMAAGAFALKLGVQAALSDETDIRIGFRTDAWAYAFAFGWVVNEARTTFRKWFTVIAVYLLASFDWSFSDPHAITLLGATFAILFVPRVPMWAPLAALVAFLAQATFYIYLTQGLAINLVRERLHISSVPLSVATAGLFGIVAFLGWQAVLRTLPRLGALPALARRPGRGVP